MSLCVCGTSQQQRCGIKAVDVDTENLILRQRQRCGNEAMDVDAESLTTWQLHFFIIFSRCVRWLWTVEVEKRPAAESEAASQ